MKELITMWKNTRMIVLAALSAAIYAAVLIPFKVAIPLIPGFTEVRPANVIPIICSLMFGPAAAWGAAIGNLIGDFFGTLGLGSIFGFIGNFLYGYIPYRMWKAFGKGEPIAGARRPAAKSALIALIAGGLIASLARILAYYVEFVKHPNIYAVAIFAVIFIIVLLVSLFLSFRYFILIFSASAACGVVIGWGVHILGLVPFSALGNIIVLNNLVASAVLGPLLLPVLYPVVKRMGLLYTDIMDENDLSRPRVWGSGLMIIAVIASLIVGNWIAIGGYGAGALGAGFAPKFSTGVQYQSDLDNGVISDGLQQEFENKGIKLSDKALLSTQKANTKWLITDSYDKYIVEKAKDSLNVYVIVGRVGLGMGLLPFVGIIFLAVAVM